MPRLGFEQEDVQWIFASGVGLVECVPEVAATTEVPLHALGLRVRVGDALDDFSGQRCNAFVPGWDLRIALAQRSWDRLGETTASGRNQRFVGEWRVGLPTVANVEARCVDDAPVSVAAGADGGRNAQGDRAVGKKQDRLLHGVENDLVLLVLRTRGADHDVLVLEAFERRARRLSA